MPISTEQLEVLREAQRRGMLNEGQQAVLAEAERRQPSIQQEQAAFRAPLPRNMADIAGEYGSPVGAVIGGIAGGIPAIAPVVGGPIGGAALGSAAGGTIGQAVQARFGAQRPSLLGEIPAAPADPLAEGARVARGTAIEAGKQALWEAAGRAPLAGARAIRGMMGGKVPPMGTTIGGVEIPRTLGGRLAPQGLVQTIESYLTKTFLGKPLREVREAQHLATRQILANLSKAPGASITQISENWSRAREATRIPAEKTYEMLRQVPSPDPTKVVQKIQSLFPEEGVPVTSRVKTALGRLIVKEDELLRGMSEARRAEFLKANPEMAASIRSLTMHDVNKTRHELIDLASNAADPNDRRVAGEAVKYLDTFIERSLPKNLLLAKRKADVLWRRSYIMDRVADNLYKMEQGKTVKAPTTVAFQPFFSMVRDLSQPGFMRHKGKVVKTAPEIFRLFPEAADRKAMTELANLMAAPGQFVQGAAGITDALARIGLALAAINIPIQVQRGDVKAAARSAGYLETLYFLTLVTARPGGAKLLVRYFNTPTAEIGPAAIRLVEGIMKEEAGLDGPPQPATPGVPVLAPPPPSAYPAIQGLMRRGPTR